MKITIESKWNTSSVEFKNSDVDLQQVFEAITGLLVIATWSESTIEDSVIEWAESIKEGRKTTKERIADITDKAIEDMWNAVSTPIENDKFEGFKGIL